MKKKFIISALSSILLMSFLALPAIGLATPPPGDYQMATGFDLKVFLENITGWLFWIVITLAAIFIILAAFTFITAGGDPEKVGTARKQLMYALIGVGVAFLARALIGFVQTFVGA